jgi:hypothetical protein
MLFRDLRLDNANVYLPRKTVLIMTALALGGDGMLNKRHEVLI